jgi:ribosome-binding protein aMBF1 (putative translation factor)
VRVLPTGFQIRAARSLVGWEQKELARRAGLHPGVMNRMERHGAARVTGNIKNLEAVLDALEKAGVEITPDGVRLVGKPRR